MLRSQIRLGRTIHRDGQTHDFGVCIDGEILSPTDDHAAVLDKIAELFHIAEEALAVEIERGESRTPAENLRKDSTPQEPEKMAPTPASPPLATPKQLAYLLRLGKEKGLVRAELDGVIHRVVESAKSLDHLTKREAGRIIDRLNSLETETV